MVWFARPARTAAWLGMLAALWGGAALAADTGNGSKNFRAPGTVPNYFSNESGPMIGGAAETQRGQLYGGAAPAAAPAQRSHLAVAMPQPVSRVVSSRGRPRSASERRGDRHKAAAP